MMMICFFDLVCPSTDLSLLRIIQNRISSSNDNNNFNALKQNRQSDGDEHGEETLPARKRGHESRLRGVRERCRGDHQSWFDGEIHPEMGGLEMGEWDVGSRAIRQGGRDHGLERSHRRRNCAQKDVGGESGGV